MLVIEKIIDWTFRIIILCVLVWQIQAAIDGNLTAVLCRWSVVIGFALMHMIIRRNDQ